MTNKMIHFFVGIILIILGLLAFTNLKIFAGTGQDYFFNMEISKGLFTILGILSALFILVGIICVIRLILISLRRKEK